MRKVQVKVGEGCRRESKLADQIEDPLAEQGVGSVCAKVEPTSEGWKFTRERVAERIGLSARGYHRVLRLARTIADLDGSDDVRKPHVAEAVSFRVMTLKES